MKDYIYFYYKIWNNFDFEIKVFNNSCSYNNEKNLILQIFNNFY